MLSRLATRPLLTYCRYNVTANVKSGKTYDAIRMFGQGSSRSETVFGHRAPKRQKLSLKERLNQPTSGLPFEIGRGAVIGAAAFGMGALCFYGAGMAKEAGALERSFGWDQLVKDRIRTTYMYFGSGIAVSAAAATAVFRSPALLRIVSNSGIAASIAMMVALVGAGMVTQSIEYKEGFGAKQIAFMGQNALLGAVIAPLSILGGPLLLRAAFMTAGIVGSLSAIAVSAPSERFLNWGGPLAIGMGAVLAANIGALFLPPTSMVGAGLHSVVLYGGLLLFSGFLLYDTQKIIKRAETVPAYTPRGFDPVNEAMRIYLDTVNIFIRMAIILSGGGSKKR